jgi:hypothetical protein
MLASFFAAFKFVQVAGTVTLDNCLDGSLGSKKVCSTTTTEIIANHDVMDDKSYQEVGALVANWSAFRSLDGDSDCDYSVC